jgi:hypothetical protein
VGRPGIRDLIGRAMVDEGFRQALFRDPDSVLADFDLGTDERAAVMKALSQNRDGSTRKKRRGLRAALMKRWAT